MVISSNREIIPLDEFCEQNQYRVERKPYFPVRWSRKSLTRFLKNQSEGIDYSLLYNMIVDTIKDFLDLGCEEWYSTLALWIWGTYFFRLFKSYPYINVNGVIGSGKSKILELCSNLAFNGEYLMGSTPPFVIGAIDANCASIFLDEAESLKKARTPEDSTLVLMLNAGYKRGIKIGKMEAVKDGKGWEARYYDPYCPKMIAGINNISDTLVSRSINLTMLISDDPKIKNSVVDDGDPRFSKIRDRFYWSAMDLHSLVSEIYRKIESPEIYGRQWEIWRPILTMAQVYVQITAPESGSDKIYSDIVSFAQNKSRETTQLTADNSEDTEILELLLEYMRTTGEEEAFLSYSQIKDILVTSANDTFHWMATRSASRYIGLVLRRTGVVQGRSPVAKKSGTAVRGLLINLQTLENRLKVLSGNS